MADLDVTDSETKTKPGKFPVLYLAVLIALILCVFPYGAGATPLTCSDEHKISVDFENGTGWDLCWRSMRRENIVLSDIHFRSSDNRSTRVISTLRLAQLHVTYDDSNLTYNDVTQFGLGGGYVAALDESECPGGELLEVNGKPGLCKRITRGDDAYRSTKEGRLTETLTLLSVSQVGAYSYLVTWKFLDDGSIAPSVGAAGALQRSSDIEDSPYGRQLEGAPGKSWLSHTHNYYWRIDFDLGAEATDDVVNEMYYQSDATGRRARVVKALTKESARTIDPDQMLAWTITDGSGEATRARGYVIEPLRYGHRLVRTKIEPFTEFDFFVTKQNDCERFISENSKFSPACGDDILAYLNDESLVNEDIVVWHRVSFHHVPRNEDRHHMHSHWDGFVMQAQNLSTGTPGYRGVVERAPPALVVPVHLTHDIDETVQVPLLASDIQNDSQITFTASGLPRGISLNQSGVLQGRATEVGNYRAEIRATNGEQTSSALIQWQISGSQNSNGSGSLTPAFLVWLAPFLVCCVIRRL